MRFTILSHASMLVESNETTLVTDPWIVGSCYWRSWWNYPKPAAISKHLDNINYIYLTHLHWDHFHGPSLRRLPQSATVLIPKSHNTRMLRDLAEFGFNQIIELPHGRSLPLEPGLKVTSYQFGLALDSVLVIDDGSTVIMDMNDCKVSGWSLNQITRRHPRVDFLLESHTSADAYPFCLKADDENDLRFRVREDYLSQFVASTEQIKPRFAVPFASNHCFLHKETWQYNATAVTPLEVKTFFDQANPADSQCISMIPGDSWDDHDGFTLQENDYFTDRDRHLAEYAREVEPILTKYYQEEDAVSLRFTDFRDYFMGFIKSVPPPVRLVFRPVVVFRVTGQQQTDWVVDFGRKKVYEAGDQLPQYSFLVSVHPAVLRDCVRRHMFTVFMPSKRLLVELPKGRIRDYFGFFHLLDLYEHEYLPIRRMLTRRFANAWLRRWREIFVYTNKVYRMFRNTAV